VYDWEIDARKLKMKYLVGKGNFGEVWLATIWGSPVAVKTMLPELQSKDKLVRRFIDEIMLMSTLHHPNVVLFLGASIRKPNLFLVLEYCVHGSLHHFLKNEAEHGVRVTMSLIYRFALDIARGVYYLHRRANVLQRDLKARNVLVDESLNAKVADFGLSRIMAEAGEDNKLTACGTPAWTAPEIVKMERYTEKVDVYSFGIILWELITRQEPYGGQKGVQIAYAAAEQGLRPKVPAYCPPEYAELMQECWAARPDDRPSFEEILKRLFQLKKAADTAAAAALAVRVAAVCWHGCCA
jgi:serine/threonine protein kinase